MCYSHDAGDSYMCCQMAQQGQQLAQAFWWTFCFLGFSGNPFSFFPVSAERERVEASPQNIPASRSTAFRAPARSCSRRKKSTMAVIQGWANSPL